MEKEEENKNKLKSIVFVSYSSQPDGFSLRLAVEI